MRRTNNREPNPACRRLPVGGSNTVCPLSPFPGRMPSFGGAICRKVGRQASPDPAIKPKYTDAEGDLRMISQLTQTTETPQSGEKDPTAIEFEGLMRRTYSRAFSAAHRMMGNSSDAEDLTQEAFVRVWSAFDRYDRSRPFEGWLFRILTNLAIDRWRRRANVNICSLDGDASPFAGQNSRPNEQGRSTSLLTYLADERPASVPEQAYLRSELGRRVRRALFNLPDDYRNVVLLADVKGFSYEEISERVGCPVGTVRSRLHRGRQLLRHHYLMLVHQEEGVDVSQDELRTGRAHAHTAVQMLSNLNRMTALNTA